MTLHPPLHRIIHVQPVHAELAWGRRDDVLHVVFVGELCTWSTEMFRSTTFDLIGDQAPSRVHLDVSEVTFIDARGVALLLGVRDLVGRSGGALALTWSVPVRRVLQLCGLHPEDVEGHVEAAPRPLRTSA